MIDGAASALRKENLHKMELEYQIRLHNLSLLEKRLKVKEGEEKDNNLEQEKLREKEQEIQEHNQDQNSKIISQIHPVTLSSVPCSVNHCSQVSEITGFHSARRKPFTVSATLGRLEGVNQNRGKPNIFKEEDFDGPGIFRCANTFTVPESSSQNSSCSAYGNFVVGLSDTFPKSLMLSSEITSMTTCEAAEGTNTNTRMSIDFVKH